MNRISILSLVFILTTGSLGAAPQLLRHTTPPSPQQVRGARSVTVAVNAVALRANARLTVRLFDRSVDVVRMRDVDHPRGYVWVGEVAGISGSSAIFAQAGNAVSGNIKLPNGEWYRVRAVPGGHVFAEDSGTNYPDELPPLIPQNPPPMAANTCADSAQSLDVMVVYTNATVTTAGSDAAVQSMVLLAVEDTNQAYLNSDIAQRLNLVHMEATTYAETGDMRTDLPAIQSGAAGEAVRIRALRDTYGADLVSMFVQNGGAYCGLAYLLESTTALDFSPYAYGVVQIGCTGNYTFAHELGHNMGARHDWYVDPTNNSPFAFNHGSYTTAPPAGVSPWRTIMSYNTACASAGVKCTPVQYFSNPSVNYPPVGGTPTGSAAGQQQTDNHQALNLTAPLVANYRCTSPGVPAVWMKDTWNDAGGQPDPLTANDPIMYASPSIRVRNQPDPNQLNQFESQSPIAGQPNYVYVKLLNGGAATNGTLSVYGTPTPNMLQTFPDGWTLLGTAAGAVVGHSSQMGMVTWTPPANLQNDGHYCLVATWTSPTEPTTAFPKDLNKFIRMNRNAVWKNVFITGALSSDEPATATFTLHGTDEQPVPASLTLHDRQGDVLLLSALANTDVTIELDPVLRAAWVAGGSKSAGMKAVGNRFRATGGVPPRFDNISLTNGKVGRVTLTFKARANTPVRPLYLDAVRTDARNRTAGVVVRVEP